MTVPACVGVFGSFIIGMFNDKFGTKRTMLFFGVWYIIALLCNVSETNFGTCISIFMIGMAIRFCCCSIGKYIVILFFLC